MNSEINHVGLTVSDIDRSTEFYCSMFSLQEVGRFEASGADIVAIGVPKAKLLISLLAGQNVLIELVQYASSSGNNVAPRTNDVGAPHICFPVDDMDVAHADLIAKGVEFVAPPSPRLGEGGGRFAYLRDPDGVMVEILQGGLTLADALAMIRARQTG